MTTSQKTKKKIFDQRYALVGLLGRGKKSAVYQATLEVDQGEHKAGEDVALKVLLPNKDLKSLKDRLRNEAQAMVMTQHPYVLKLVDFQHYEDLSYLALEYAPFGDIRRYLSTLPEKKLDPYKAHLYFKQLAEALHFCHSVGVIHRDIKPENILVINDDEVRLADFGLAQLVENPSLALDLQKAVGTMDYLAPEVLEGKEYSEKSDFYSLGITFYELLTGSHPFAEFSLAEILNSRKRTLKHINEIIPQLNKSFGNILMQLLENQPQVRVPDSRKLLSQIEESSLLSSVSEIEERSKESEIDGDDLLFIDEESELDELNLDTNEENEIDDIDEEDEETLDETDDFNYDELFSDEDENIDSDLDELSDETYTENQEDDDEKENEDEIIEESDDLNDYESDTDKNDDIDDSDQSYQASGFDKDSFKNDKEKDLFKRYPLKEKDTPGVKQFGELLDLQEQPQKQINNDSKKIKAFEEISESDDSSTVSLPPKTVNSIRNNIKFTDMDDEPKEVQIPTNISQKKPFDNQLATKTKKEAVKKATNINEESIEESIPPVFTYSPKTVKQNVAPPHKKSPKKTIFLLILGIVLGSIFFESLGLSKFTKLNETIKKKASETTTLVKSKKEIVAIDKIALNQLPNGLYSGTIEGLLLGSDTIRFGFVVKPQTTSVLLGINGWVPSSTIRKTATMLETSSNSWILRFNLDETSEQMQGTVINLVTGEKGTWKIDSKK